MLHMPSEDIMVSNHLEVFIAIIPTIKGIAERFPVFLGSKSISQIFNLL